MTKTEIDYSKTIMYKIVCNDLNFKEIYVGHTTNFKVRKNKHKYDCTKSNLLVHKTIRGNGGWTNFIIFFLCSCRYYFI